MLKNNLRLLMADRRINSISALMRMTNLCRWPIDKLYKDADCSSLDLNSLIAICDALDCKLSDLIEYEPEQKK